MRSDLTAALPDHSVSTVSASAENITWLAAVAGSGHATAVQPKLRATELPTQGVKRTAGVQRVQVVKDGSFKVAHSCSKGMHA
jgi:hypothetical protein